MSSEILKVLIAVIRRRYQSIHGLLTLFDLNHNQLLCPLNYSIGLFGSKHCFKSLRQFVHLWLGKILIKIWHYSFKVVLKLFYGELFLKIDLGCGARRGFTNLMQIRED